jgi:drug/metabolite transporter (DMT)-like permease
MTRSTVLALLAAFAFAFGNVLQQKGTLETPSEADDPRFLVQILRRPVWLAGAGMQGIGWVLQAVALNTGSLIVVQSLTTMSLVIALPLGARFTGQQISRRVWLGAAAMVVGIVLFLSVGSPQGGSSTPPAAAWWSAGVMAVILIVVLGRMGQRRQGAARALLFGSAAGVGFALQAAVTKVFVTVVGQGIDAILSSWTIYVLIISAVVGFALQQAALKTGVLAPAIASSNAVTLFGSVAFGATVFGERLSTGDARLAPALVGLGVALVGIILLAGAKPPQTSGGMPRIDQITTTEGSQTERSRRHGELPRH